MKNNRNIFVKTLSTLAIIFAFTCTTSLSAQGPGGPPPGATDTTDNEGDAIPLDGGLTALLIGAAAFGIKKIRDAKNDKL